MPHSILPISSMGRWVNCYGSALRESQLSDESSRSSKEGNATHSIIPSMINSAMKAGDISGREYVGTTDPDGTLITEEMADSASVFVNCAQQIMRRHGVFSEEFIHCEKAISGETIHPICYGTPDLTIDVIKKDNTLYCLDHKNGYGRVGAFRNWQGIGYTVSKLDGRSDVRTDTKIVIIIVQPHAFKPDGPIDTWELTAGELNAYLQQGREAAHEAMKQNAACRTGPWCKDCKAMLTCDASQAASLNVIDVVDHHAGVQHIDPASLALELKLLDRSLKLVEQRRDALREHVDLLLSSGSQVPGYESDFTRSSTIWNETPEKIKSAGELFGVKLVAEKFKTPKQAISAGVPEDVINGMSKVVKGNRTVVAIDDDLLPTIFGKLSAPEVFKK